MVSLATIGAMHLTSNAPLEVIGPLVAVMGLSTLALAVGVFFLMQVRYSRHLAREARRLMFSDIIVPPWHTKALEDLWVGSSRADRAIIEEVLAMQTQYVEKEQSAAFERAVTGSAIYAGLLRELQSGKQGRKVRAARILGYFHDPRGIQALADSILSPDTELSLTSLVSLGRLQSSAALPALIAFLQSPAIAPDVTVAAALASCARERPGDLSPLLGSPRDRSRIVGALALSELADPTVLAVLLKACRDPHPEVRAKAARGLARIPDSSSVESLTLLAQDPSWFVRVRALDALGRLRPPSAESPVLAALEDDVREVRYRAASALRRMKGMGSEVILKVLAEGSRRAFDTLISEWERAGFLDTLAQDLCEQDQTRSADAEKSVRALIAADFRLALENLLLVHPNINVRLTLARLLLENAHEAARKRLLALAKDSKCDLSVATSILKAIPDTAAIVPQGGSH